MITKEHKSNSEKISEEARRYIAGGVVSLNRRVTPNIIFKQGKGSKIYDIDGLEYIDYHAAFAPHFLGHNNETVNNAVVNTIKNNLSLIGSGTNELEVALAKMLCEAVPSLELVQITNTGSEATAHAIRLSRAFTGREHIILTLGGYNGWHNDVARAVMPGLEQIGKRVSNGEYPFIPSSDGINKSVKSKVHIVNYNDLESVEHVMKQYPVACVLTEPVLQNVGVVLPKQGYLQGLIDLCNTYGSVCAFDEVKTGFRSALGGYQAVAGVTPHISVFGKAVANGYPLGVIGGKKEIMQLFDADDNEKRVLIAGTYNAHPFNTAAAIATLEILNDPLVYRQIESKSERLYTGLKSIFKEKSIPASLAKNASAFCVYFSETLPHDLHDILEHTDFAFDIDYRRALIKQGIYHIPLACKQGSISYAHTEADIDKTLEITAEVIRNI
ncbi:MAG: aspartate aminotransferase family protein [Chitinophagaceae bacterium]